MPLTDRPGPEQGFVALPATKARRAVKSALMLVFVNLAVLVGLLVPVELIFGTWIRPLGLRDLKRFSIPVGTAFEYDVSGLYTGAIRNPIKYSRDEWGLRGSYGRLASIDVLTIGGSTTEQRYLDDDDTWQEVARRELQARGRPLAIANAGVDGQSTVGHMFSIDYWFPLLPDLHPGVMLFYVGANDVLRREDRAEFDSSVDARSWRVRSVTYQLYRTFRSNQRARTAQVVHGRMAPSTPDDLTDQGLLSVEERRELSRQVTGTFLANVDALRQRANARGSRPVFMTQTAFGWNADRSRPRGRKGTLRILGVTTNFADVAALHQDLNHGLMKYCATHGVACFDLANDVAFDAEDYYDNLHNTPRGARKIGRYLASRLADLEPASAQRRP